MPNSADGRTAKLARLTPQERECLRLVAEQRSSKEIANALGISKASVDTYCNRARAKLGVASRRDAARMVRAAEPPPPAAAAAAPQPAPPPQADAWAGGGALRLPSVAAMGPLQRLWVIMMGASVFALAFGVLVNGLESLNAVITTSHAYAAPAKLR